MNVDEFKKGYLNTLIKLAGDEDSFYSVVMYVIETNGINKEANVFDWLKEKATGFVNKAKEKITDFTSNVVNNAVARSIEKNFNIDKSAIPFIIAPIIISLLTNKFGRTLLLSGLGSYLAYRLYKSNLFNKQEPINKQQKTINLENVQNTMKQVGQEQASANQINQNTSVNTPNENLINNRVVNSYMANQANLGIENITKKQHTQKNNPKFVSGLTY